MTSRIFFMSFALIGVCVASVLVPGGIFLPIILLGGCFLYIFPLEKCLYYLWMGLVASAFFGAYLALPGYESIFVFRVLLLGHAALFLILPAKEWEAPKNMKWLFILLGTWLVSFSLTLFWADSINAGFRYMYYLLELSYLLFLSVYYINSRQRLMVLGRILTAIYWLQLLIGLIEVLTGKHMSQSSAFVYETRTSAFQPTGLLFNTNDYAFFLAMFFPFVFWYLTKWKKPYGVISLVLTSILSSVLVIMTYSRLGFIVFFSCLLVLVVIYAREWCILIFSSLGMIASSVLLLSPHIFQKFTGTIEMMFTQKGASTSERIELSKMLGQMIVDSKFLGVGAGNSPIKLEQYRLGRSRVQEIILSPHNLWLEVLADGGIFGLVPIVIILSLVGVGLYFALEKWQQRVTVLETIPLLMLFVFTVAGVALSTVIDKRYLWLGVGVAAALINLIILEWKEANV